MPPSHDTLAWIGLDVGGANLKTALADGRAWSTPFPLWRQTDELPSAIAQLLTEIDPSNAAAVALTMTGELADCYATKAEGVRAIVRATLAGADRRRVRVATVDDRWLTPDEAAEQPRRVAAANWRLGARWCARRWSDGVWIDVGSTTIDVVPFSGGQVAARGLDDPARLLAGELLYQGVRRTPICAVVRTLPFAGEDCPVAAEWFATTADAWMLLGPIDEDPSDVSTADGRPLTRPFAQARLARMVCADESTFGPADALRAAEAIAAAQEQALDRALRNVERPGAVVVSGEGAFLARRVLERLPVPRVVDAGGVITSRASRCLPAYAAAALAAEELGRAPC